MVVVVAAPAGVASAAKSCECVVSSRYLRLLLLLAARLRASITTVCVSAACLRAVPCVLCLVLFVVGFPLFFLTRCLFCYIYTT